MYKDPKFNFTIKALLAVAAIWFGREFLSEFENWREPEVQRTLAVDCASAPELNEARRSFLTHNQIVPIIREGNTLDVRAQVLPDGKTRVTTLEEVKIYNAGERALIGKGYWVEGGTDAAGQTMVTVGGLCPELKR